MAPAGNSSSAAAGVSHPGPAPEEAPPTRRCLCDYRPQVGRQQGTMKNASRIFRVSWILYPMAPNPACPSVLPILPVQFPDPLPLGVPSQGICTTVSPLAQPKTQKTASPHQHTEGKVDSVREGRHPEMDQDLSLSPAPGGNAKS